MSKVHLSLNVSNLEVSAKFYKAFLGRSPRKLHPGYANFDVDSPPLRLALVEKPGRPQGEAINHLGVLVPTPAHVEAAKRRLIEAGLATFSEEDATCCYAVQDKVWAHDPDGNAWEVYAVTEDLGETGLPMNLSAPKCCS